MSNFNNNDQPLPFGVASAVDRRASEPMLIDSERQGDNQGQVNRPASIPRTVPQAVSRETGNSQTTPAASASEKKQAGSSEKPLQQIFSPLDQPGAPAPITGLHVDQANLQEGFEEAVQVAQQRVLALSIELSKQQVSTQRDQVTRLRANLADAQMHLESLLHTRRLMAQFQQQAAAPTPSSSSLTSASSESSTASSSAGTTSDDTTHKRGKLPVPNNMPWLQIEGHHKHNTNKSKEMHSSIDRYLTRFDVVLNGHGMDKDTNWERLLSMHILEEDFSWFEDTLADRHLPWCEAKEIIRSHFGASLARQKMSAKVWSLKMGKNESFRAYKSRFRTARHAAGVPDNNSLAMKFLGSLSKSLKVEIKSIFRRQNFEPHSINDVANQARDIVEDFSDESASDEDRGRSSRSSRRSRRSRRSPSPSPSRSASPARGRGPKKSSKRDDKNPHSVKGCKWHGKQAHHTTEVCNGKGLKNKPYKPSPSLAASKHAPAHVRRSASTPCDFCGEPFYPGHLADCTAKKGKSSGERVVRALRPVSKSKDSQPAPAASNSDDSDDEMDIDQKAQGKQLINTQLDPHTIYLPIILQSNHKISGILDTGATISTLSSLVCNKIGCSVNLPSIHVKAVGKNNYVNVQGETEPLEIRCNKRTIRHSFAVVDTEEPMLVGSDLYSKLGIYIGGLPYSFDEDNDSDIEEEIGYIDVPNDSPAGTSSERALLERTLKPLIDVNQQIPKNAFCTVPESKISLETIDNVTERVKSYPVPKRLEPLLDETVRKWLDDGIITYAPEFTAWHSPITFAPKKDVTGKHTGEKRPCLDPRHLNRHLRDDHYELPLIEEVFETLSGASIFSTLDLKSAFHRFEIVEHDRPKTTFSVRNIQYMFVGCPFGLKHISPKFQRVMSTLLKDMPFATAFVDDVVIFSNTMDEHIPHVAAVTKA